MLNLKERIKMTKKKYYEKPKIEIEDCRQKIENEKLLIQIYNEGRIDFDNPKIDYIEVYEEMPKEKVLQEE